MSTAILRNELLKLSNAETNIVMKYMDEETGEIPENIFEKLEKIGETKLAITDSAIQSFHEFNDFLTLIQAKIDRLTALKKKYATTTSSIKNILSKALPEGEKINADNYQISWRKSESIELDEFISLKDIEEKHPNLIEIKKSIKKNDAKKLLKEGVKIEGMNLRTKLNIQIK